MIHIIGVDPGLASTGYGVIAVDSRRMHHIRHGVIATRSNMASGDRLLKIFRAIQELIDTYNPKEAGVESLYFARNISSALPVAQARGVVLLAFAQAGIPTSEYPPQAIKQSIVGEGRAEKRQVTEFVRVLLNLTDAPKPDHASDALAAAICHHNNRGYRALIESVTAKMVP